ncbi:unnamed protein product [Effrenium voratum]|nr:unnamed protein product [Effrenium voratum]
MQHRYMVGDDSNSCLPAFMKLDIKKGYGPAMILGEVFMRHFFTVFSRGNGELSDAKIGFAKAKAGANPKVHGHGERTSFLQDLEAAPLMRRAP